MCTCIKFQLVLAGLLVDASTVSLSTLDDGKAYACAYPFVILVYSKVVNFFPALIFLFCDVNQPLMWWK